MNRKRTSIIWNCPDEEFIKLVTESFRMRDVLAHFGLDNKGNNFITAKNRIQNLNLDTSHFMTRTDSSNFARQVSLEEFKKKWLTENSLHNNRESIKARLVKFNLLKYECANCGNCGFWSEKPLTLQLEHKNGISNDNRLENLAFLCPNCHSQTDTYAGKKQKIHSFCSCGIEKYKEAKRCEKCSRLKSRKTKWPTKEELQKLVWEQPMTSIGKRFGVSGHTIANWIKSYKVTSPPRGYWIKKRPALESNQHLAVQNRR